MQCGNNRKYEAILVFNIDPIVSDYHIIIITSIINKRLIILVIITLQIVLITVSLTCNDHFMSVIKLFLKFFHIHF